ncbi:MAG: rRNA (cytidine-2'-O-)-methyltransferase, partial [Tateyamaria sp.]
RELTKRFEEVRSGTLGSLARDLDGTTVKGEIVVLIGRAARKDVNEKDIDAALSSALTDMSVKDAARFVSETLDVPRRLIYQRALELARDRD